MEHPYGWLSLLPPVAAIVLAIATRRVILSLLGGVFLGALILAGWNPLTASADTVTVYLWPVLVSESKLYVAAFTLLMGAMVGIVNRAGGMRGLVDVVSKWANNRQRGQLTVWVLGLLIFFDDYANTILLGGTLRPLCDRLKISREKLAYLIDSTAAPVAGLALVSTWVAAEIEFVKNGIDKLPGGVEWQAYDLFVASLPYRFYVWLALFLVPVIGWLNRDFGPMLTAERNALQQRETPLADIPIDDVTAPIPGAAPRWWNAAAPVLITVGVILWLLYTTGLSNAIDDGVASPVWREIFGYADTNAALLWGALLGATTAGLLALVQRLLPMSEVIRAGASGASLMLPALAILWLASALSAMTGNSPNGADEAKAELSVANATAVLKALEDKALEDKALEDKATPVEAQVAYLLKNNTPPVDAALAMQNRELSPPAVIAALSANKVKREQLIQAAAVLDAPPAVLLAALAKHDIEMKKLPRFYPHRGYRLYTGMYLGAVLDERLPAALLPTIVFLLAAAVAFATGSSWGTMGIVMPLVIPLVYSALGPGDVSPYNPLLLGSIGGVLAGAIFGDHCSPISDTTVLSSQASGCDHVAHVRTQLPYALLAGFVAIVFGTLPLGLGIPCWATLPIGCGVMLAVVRLFGKRVNTGASPASSQE